MSNLELTEIVAELAIQVKQMQRRIDAIPATRMVPPTVGEVAEYARKMGYAEFPAVEFHDHYTMVGWVYGKGAGKPIKDWRAAVRTWQRQRRPIAIQGSFF